MSDLDQRLHGGVTTATRKVEQKDSLGWKHDFKVLWMSGKQVTEEYFMQALERRLEVFGPRPCKDHSVAGLSPSSSHVSTSL